MRLFSQTAQKAMRPVKVLQYGEGNFLRGFADYMIDIANEQGVTDMGVTVVIPIRAGGLADFHNQDCMYTVLLRGGTVTDARVVTCVNNIISAYYDYDIYAACANNPQLRFIISNTTEAGIIYDETDEIKLKPPKTYPGKLTKLLYERYSHFAGAAEAGLIILPVELIENNGDKLKECCLKLSGKWGLPPQFDAWINGSCVFCNTLVDRIITGYPKDEAAALEAKWGYTDKLIVTGEPFALWVIECDNPALVSNEFPLDKAGLPVIFTDNLKPYRERKVYILNGAHTSTALAAARCGLATVGDIMNDTALRAFLEQAIYEELAPFVQLPPDEVNAYAASVIRRFENPFIKHNLRSIALNSVSKFKTRVLPAILGTYRKTGTLPDRLTFSLAALVSYYENEDITDEPYVVDFFTDSKQKNAGELIGALLKREDFWGEDLSNMPGFAEKTSAYLRDIREYGMRKAIERVNSCKALLT